MIRHIVLLKFRPGVAEAEIRSIFADLVRLRDLVPGVRDVAAGASQSPEKIERGYMHGFTVDLDDWAALAAYQAHSAHRAVGARLVAACQGGLDGILVVDIEVT